MTRFFRLLFVVIATTTVAAQSNRIDGVSPYAPELAAFGEYAIGVRTFQVTDRNRPDIVNTKPGAPVVRYDRTLTLEVWYPARLPAGLQPGGEYRMITRDPSITAVLHGRAVRDAAPLDAGAPSPLVVISHGYPGNRYLLSHLAENLASKGFVVASIDHKDSTYDDQLTFASTLYNRPFDQLFVVSEMERLGRTGSGSFLSGRVDASRAGIVGYSMGGYGALNVIGGGYSDASVISQNAPPNELLRERAASNPAYRSARDPRVRAVIAIGPWGMPAGFWDAEGLKGIHTPLLVVAGSVDDVAGYRDGPRAIWEGAVNADRYLLTFVNAGHNAAAPIPAPVETYAARDPSRPAAFTHYADPVWDTVRMNNILQHFATAFFELHLKERADRGAYLNLVPDPSAAVFSLKPDGSPNADHTYWRGFQRRTATGLLFEHRDRAR
jgi:predicted dienelactone hydrolase